MLGLLGTILHEFSASYDNRAVYVTVCLIDRLECVVPLACTHIARHAQNVCVAIYSNKSTEFLLILTKRTNSTKLLILMKTIIEILLFHPLTLHLIPLLRSISCILPEFAVFFCRLLYQLTLLAFSICFSISRSLTLLSLSLFLSLPLSISLSLSLCLSLYLSTSFPYHSLFPLFSFSCNILAPSRSEIFKANGLCAINTRPDKTPDNEGKKRQDNRWWGKA